MERRYRIFDSIHEDLYIGVDSSYFKIAEAKQVYRESLTTEKKDDSIMFEIAKRNAKEVDALLTFGVEEGERFALALLNLCQSIKS